MAKNRILLYISVAIVACVIVLILSSTGIIHLGKRGGAIQQNSPIDDFNEFPCLKGKITTLGKSITMNCIRAKRLTTGQQVDMKWCATLHATKDTPICTYNPKLDLISGHLHDTGVWEKDLVDIMLDTLKSIPDMMLFDVGSNIGVYCISAAVSNRTVACLDANYENIRKITSSLQLGGLTDKATLIWNAVSNEHQRLSFHIAKGNVGMSRIADLKKWRTDLEMNMVVDAITLNDLGDYTGFKNRPIYMKIDVESHELFVLLGAMNFFKIVDVRVVQIELLEPDTKWEVIELFEKYGFLPHRHPTGGEVLKKKNAFVDWPGDVYFVRNMQQAGQDRQVMVTIWSSLRIRIQFKRSQVLESTEVEPVKIEVANRKTPPNLFNFVYRPPNSTQLWTDIYGEQIGRAY